LKTKWKTDGRIALKERVELIQLYLVDRKTYILRVNTVLLFQVLQ